jgi:hypothetical protein
MELFCSLTTVPSQTECYATTTGHSVSVLGFKLHVEIKTRFFVTSRNFQIFLCWACLLQMPLIFASTVIIMPNSRESHGNIMLYHIRDSFSLYGQITVFISPRNKMDNLNPQEMDFIFTASNCSQGPRWKYSNRTPHGSPTVLESYYFDII